MKGFVRESYRADDSVYPSGHSPWHMEDLCPQRCQATPVLSWTLSHPLSTSLKPPCSPRVTSWSRSAHRSPTPAFLGNYKERQRAYRLRRQSECLRRWCGTRDKGQPKLNILGSVCLRIVVILTMRCAIATAISLARHQNRLCHV